MASDDQLGVIDDCASEYVAERLSKADIGGESETDIAVVGEVPQRAAGPGGATKPGELGAHPLTSPTTPKQGAELAVIEPEQHVPESENVELLLSRAGFIKRVGPVTYEIPTGHKKGMHAPARFFASPRLLRLVVGELQSGGGFTAAVEQLSNVATLPGVRVLRTNLHESDLDQRTRDKLADTLFEVIPVGVGESGAQRLNRDSLDAVLKDGMKWTEKAGLSWPEDRQVCEEQGCFAMADPSKVSDRAKKRGLLQLGSLGSGNHYTEIQTVQEIYDPAAAAAMGIEREGQVCVMIHTGSRGLGHQVCTDALATCDRAVKKAGIKLVDRQLACMPIGSPEGQDYLKAMAAAANFAFCNRTVVMSCVRRAFEKVFGRSARELGMNMVYDVAHNVAKQEEHVYNNRKVKVLVHRKGATRAFPPHHPQIPNKYKDIGQPILIGGSMGTSSYILTGTQGAMEHSFGSTCHGAGRALSRSKAKQEIDSKEVLRALNAKGISIRVATKHLAAEEAPESYNDVDEVVETCHKAGISRKVVRLRPVAVVKG
ncbi:hypothetical protein N2152v2_008032 [Parachlorella kessleri]